MTTRRTAEAGFRLMRDRDVRKLQQIHLAQTSKGIYCLDFARWFDSLEDFDKWIVPTIQALLPGELINGASESEWRQFVEFETVRMIMLPVELATGRGMRNAVLRKGEFR